MDFLKEKPNVLFEYFLKDYGSLFPIDAEECRAIRKTDKIFLELSNKWYDDLAHQDTRNIYEVYNHDYYFIDIFNCFITYSRDYIKRIKKSSHFSELHDAKVIVDIGCGISYSTCLLKQVFPEAKVYAINLKDTKQAIANISTTNLKQCVDWSKNIPEGTDNDEHISMSVLLCKEACSGDDKNNEKIIKNISKEILLNKQVISDILL